jgi:hypothetical protein
MILYSEKAGNTLIVEWTESEVPSEKEKQMAAYGSITKDDVMIGAAVPVAAAASHDVTVAVHAKHGALFVQAISQNGHAFPVLECTLGPDSARISKKGAPFSYAGTESFFSQTLDLKRVPTSYVPFPPEHFTHEDIAHPVIAYAYSLFVGGGGEYSIEEFCETCYYDVWPILGSRARSRLRDHTRHVLGLLAQFPVAKLFLVKRMGSNPSRWGFADVNRHPYNKRLHVLQKLPSFIRYVGKRPPQQGTFEF